MPGLVLLYPPRTSHWLTRNWTRASTVRGTLFEAWGWSELYIRTSFILTVNSMRFRLKTTMLILFTEVVIVNCEGHSKTHYNAVGKCRVLFMLKTMVHALNKVIAFLFQPYVSLNTRKRITKIIFRNSLCEIYTVTFCLVTPNRHFITCAFGALVTTYQTTVVLDNHRRNSLLSVLECFLKENGNLWRHK
jgi:hypothetical protein